MDSYASPHRPSGIPRPSRLPVPSKRSSHVFTRAPEHPIEPERNGHSTAALPNRPATVNAPAPRAPAPNGTRRTSRPALTTRVGAVRPSSRASQRRFPSVPRPAGGEDEENHDQLGSLEGFRAASRQGLPDDDSPVELPEPSGPDEALFRPRDRSRPRPSLSDRTIESLQTVPSTPKDRRRSGIFSPAESPMGPPHRPASALSRRGSGNGLAGTGDSTFAGPTTRPAASPQKAARASTNSTARASFGGFGFTPAKQRTASATLTQKLQAGKDPAQRPPSPLGRDVSNGPGNLLERKAVAPRASKLKPVFGDGVAPATSGSEKAAQPKSPAAAKRAVSGSKNASSAALREQIAAAKAAARKEKSKHDSPQQPEARQHGSFDPDIYADPFNQAPKDGKHMLRNRIKVAWTDGKLNIAAMGLKQLPDEVLHMYDTAAMEEGKVNWAEVVDLTKFIAADNELEELGGDVFPDKSADELAADEDSQGNPFGGLEILDLHGNALLALPMGLRRLEMLSSLNLAHNKLDNASLDIISQIKSLKELRLGHNNLSGSLSSNICGLSHLQLLDVQANRILGLPESLRELTSLRVVNIAGNQLTALPMEALQQLPLTELDANGNALIGSLFPLGGVSAHPTLQVLNVANNSLAALTFAETLDLPRLRTLDVTNNHITVLPPVSGWTELITLTAGDNKISELPAGFTSLQKLRNVNFASNELYLIDPKVAKMESLESLILASNPLRDKKYLTMTAADIRHDLKARLEPDDLDDGEISDPETVIGPDTLSTRGWTLKANGVLDLSSKGFADEVDDDLDSFLQSNDVKQLILHSNKLAAIPPVLGLGQNLRVLDLSDNAFGIEYVPVEFEMPALQELNLSKCRLTSLEPLVSRLLAPRLHTLNVNANRLAGPVPVLRMTYPALTTFLAAENKFNSVAADTLRGLHTVNLASNDLPQLPAEIGLLWDEGLKAFEVGRNAFRVPNYRVLEKGTEATLRWLRDRLHTGQDTHGFD